MLLSGGWVSERTRLWNTCYEFQYVGFVEYLIDSGAILHYFLAIISLEHVLLFRLYVLD